jgi:hypothetical protein
VPKAQKKEKKEKKEKKNQNKELKFSDEETNAQQSKTSVGVIKKTHILPAPSKSLEGEPEKRKRSRGVVKRAKTEVMEL